MSHTYPAVPDRVWDYDYRKQPTAEGVLGFLGALAPEYRLHADFVQHLHTVLTLLELAELPVTDVSYMATGRSRQLTVVIAPSRAGVRQYLRLFSDWPKVQVEFFSGTDSGYVQRSLPAMVELVTRRYAWDPSSGIPLRGT